MECAQVKMNIQVFIPGVCSFTLGEAPSGKVRWHIIIIKIIFVKIFFIKIIAIQIILREDTTIDLDGPGPLPPFSVTCYRSSKGFVTAVRSTSVLQPSSLATSSYIQVPFQNHA